MSEKVRRGGYKLPEKQIKPEDLQKLHVRRTKFKQESASKKVEISPNLPPNVNDVEKKVHKIAFVDIRSIIDRFAMTQARAKAKEHLEEKSKWYNRWFVRQTEAGYIDKYFEEAREEILKNKNLLSEIEIRWLKKSEGKQLDEAAEERQYEILDEVVESVFQEQLAWEKNIESKAGPEKREIGNIAGLDAVVAELLADYVLGQNGVTSRKKFDQDVNDYILHNPKFSGVLGVTLEEKTIYASNLFHVAEQYKKHFEEKLLTVEKEFSPEQAEYIKNYLGRVINIDVTHAKMQADLYQTKSKGAMRIVEGAVDLTQSPYLKALSLLPEGLRSKLAGNQKVKRILDKTAGLALGNPVLYAYLGNRVGYLAATGSASLAAKALLMGTASMVGIGPGMVMVLGAGVGAGVYLGARAAVERFRDINRREEESVLGLRNKEKIEVASAGDMALRVLELSEKKTPLTDAEKEEITRYMATLRLQDSLGRNLLGAEEEEGRYYKTNFLAVQDLRKVLAQFWNSKSGEFGSNPEDQLSSLNLKLSEQERQILEQLSKTDKEVAKEIKNRGLRVGLTGAGITMAAGVLAPGVGKLLKMGFNKTQEFFGSQPSFDTSKTTFTEEVWNSVYKKVTGKDLNLYKGDFNTLAFAGRSGGVGNFIEMPKNGALQLIRIEQNGSEYFTFSNNGQIIPDVKIPVDTNGHIDQAALNSACSKLGWQVEKISQNIPVSGGVNNYELYAQVKGEHLNNADFTNIRTRSFLDNGTEISDLNELKFHVNTDVNGNALISTDLLEGNSFKMNGEILEKPDLLNLLQQGKLRFVFLTKEGPLSFVMNENQELVIPKGSKQFEMLFDSVTGKIRSGVTFGSGVVEQGGNGDLYIDWMNSENGSGSGLTLSNGSSVAVEGFRIRPPVAHEVGEPFIFADYFRDKDAKLDAIRAIEAKALEDKLTAKEKQALREAMERIPAHERFAMACQAYDTDRKNKVLDEVKYNKICELYLLNEEQKVDLLKYALARHGLSHEEIHKLEHEASGEHAEHGADHDDGDDEHADAHGHKKHGDGHSHGAKPKKAHVKQVPKNGMLEKLKGLWREDRIHAQLPHEAGPNKSKLVEINHWVNNGPHLEFSAEDGLLKADQLDKTNKLAENVYQLLRAEGLDLEKYRTKIFKINFAKSGEPTVKEDSETGLTVINVQSSMSANSIARLVLNKLKGAEASLSYRFKAIDEVNEYVNNKEPHLEFRYDPIALSEIRPEALVKKASDIQKELHKLAKASPKHQILLKLGIVKVNLINQSVVKKTERDAHDNLIVNISFDSDTKAAAQILLRQMEKSNDSDVKETEDLTFLDEINQEASNTNPHIRMIVTDASVIKKLGGAIKAKEYLQNVRKQVSDRWDMYKASEDAQNPQAPNEIKFYANHPLFVEIVNKPQQELSASVAQGGGWVIRVAPGENMAGIANNVKIQIERLVDQHQQSLQRAQQNQNRPNNNQNRQGGNAGNRRRGRN